tara:strand:- start:12663 stop:13865 length:1203 start_codon:yes stop_codon:yes gene_type:complete
MDATTQTSHPLMNAYTRAPVRAARGEGCYLWDEDGTRYLDFLAGVAVNALGHCHPGLVTALCDQARTLWHASNLVRMDGQDRLAGRLCSASFADAVFFTNSGSEAVDFALKLVRRYHNMNGAPGRWRTITFADGFHGRSMADIAAGGQAKLTKGYEPVVPGFDCVAFADLDAVRAATGPETAAILLEPVQGDGGVRVFPDDFVKALRQHCDDNDLLLVLDEVQTGIGRTGRFFAHEWAGVTPDIAACAKGLGAGFPLGAVLTTAAVAETVTPGSHGSTLGGNPLAMAVGNALLDVILADGFLDGLERIAQSFRTRLEDIASRHPAVIAEIRGRGLLLGLRCDEAVPNTSMLAALRNHGMLAGPAGYNVVRILPPLIITEAEVDEACRAIEAACRDLSKSA